MPSALKTMTQDQQTMLLAVEGEMTTKELANQFEGTFEPGRVAGLLASLGFRRLVENRKGKWRRTAGGNIVAEKIRTGTYGK